MSVLIVLEEYLDTLKKQEAIKIGPRLQIPTLTDLSMDASVHYATMNRVAKNKVVKLDLQLVDTVIKAMRQRGFDMELTDFMIWKDD